MISTAIKKIVAPCWKPSSAKGDKYNSPSSSTKNPNGRFDGLVWRKNLGKHVNGEFSMAVIKANNLLEDYSQLDSGPLTAHETENTTHGTFVGIYDGHGGPEAARFVCDHLLNNIKRFTSGGIMSAEVIMKAYLATEEEFLSLVKSLWEEKPQLASVGSCCLVGVVCNGYLYIANVGDSRVVLGQRDVSDGLVKPIQLSCEHNVCYEHVRNELHSMHPHDPNIVVLKRNCWRVKGLIQVSRSIGDAYLKRVEFNKPPLLPKFRLEEHFSKPILTAEPWISVKKLDSQDKFLIFASDGLWDHLTNKRAVDIINTNPRNGVAKKLVKAALCEAAKKREMRYSDLKKIDRGVRRHFHDDITVIVVFLDFQLVSRTNHRGRSLSIKGANYQPPPDIDIDIVQPCT